MNRKKQLTFIVNTILALVLAFSIIQLTGCKSSPPPEAESNQQLQVGYIDSDQLVKEFPKLIQFMNKKEKESMEIQTLLSRGEKLSEDEKKKIKDTTVNFLEAENELVDNFVETVRNATRKVAEKKKLDVVINNKSSEPIIEYGGIDITEDVRTQIQEMETSSEENKNGEK
ncbi:MAG: hypothetical protein ACLFQV_03280 [Vulcanimicrobiota bacterium]